MAQLTFSKQQNGMGKDIYVAEMTVDSRYALHIERKGSGNFYMEQRSTSSGAYAPCVIPSHLYNTGKVIDYMFDHGFYPMHVRFVSETEVESAELQEVTE